MATAQAVRIKSHPYADGSFKKMLIDGKWLKAASGKTFESRNPATGELLATVAEGDREDINRAVASEFSGCDGLRFQYSQNGQQSETGFGPCAVSEKLASRAGTSDQLITLRGDSKGKNAKSK